MADSVKPVPDGYHTLTPHLIVKNAPEAIEFYKKALGATERGRLPGPDGRIMHAELQVGDSRFFLFDECPEYQAFGPQGTSPAPVSMHLYVEDVDAAFQRAVDAGAAPKMPVADMFWGDRYGKFVDPFGHQWSVASHKVDMTVEQMQEQMKAAFAKSC